MRHKTLDILDADLQADYDKYVNLDYEDRFKIFSHDIRIDPLHSEKKYLEIEPFLSKLNWKTVKYYEACEQDLITEITDNSIGIYFFSVRPKQTILGLPSYVLYVGIAGEKGSERPLRDRLCDYLRIGSLRKRQNVHKFLQLYYKEAYITYSFYDGDYKDLEKLENLLHEYFQPKFAIRDFDPETKAARKSWN